MKMLRLTLSLLFCFYFFPAFSQLKCATESYSQITLKNHPSLKGRLGAGNQDPGLEKKLAALTGRIRIPVYVHVLYNENKPGQRVDSLTIKAQIDQLNLDFSATNQDLDKVPDVFRPLTADCGFFFDLLKIDFHKTTIEEFNCGKRGLRTMESDPIKFSKYKGVDGKASTQYLNIWIGNITNGRGTRPLLGYATYPGGIGKFDGIVLNYRTVGSLSLGKPQEPYDKGRTLTHEVGHWLNLRHIWGDLKCGNDSIPDTPTQEGSNAGIPNYPKKSLCNENEYGDMFMNFMDTSDDEILIMFTQAQRDRMRSLFVEGGRRASFLHNSFNNDIITLDTSQRKDVNAPVITNLKNTSVINNNSIPEKKISWTSSDMAAAYVVQARVLGTELWEVQDTKTNSILLKNLQPKKTYELIIRTIFKNGSSAIDSAPYLFESGNTYSKVNE